MGKVGTTLLSVGVLMENMILFCFVFLFVVVALKRNRYFKPYLQ